MLGVAHLQTALALTSRRGVLSSRRAALGLRSVSVVTASSTAGRKHLCNPPTSQFDRNLSCSAPKVHSAANPAASTGFSQDLQGGSGVSSTPAPHRPQPSTGDTIQDVQDKVAAVLQGLKDFEARWQSTKDRFQATMDAALASAFSHLHINPTNHSNKGGITKEQKEAVLGDVGVTPEGVAKRFKDGKYKNIVVAVGAGISVSAGIPDFRTPGTGLFDNLQKYKLNRPEDVFDINYFVNISPLPFYQLAKDIWPGQYSPTLAHRFIKALNDEEVLLRCYTQNIDGLERLAGLPPDCLVEAHGTFSSAHCSHCGAFYPAKQLEERILAGKVPVTCRKCVEGLVKPDIVFYGESLPDRFDACLRVDMDKCDLLIVMGTSLAVAPFCNIVDMVDPLCPRVLINRESVGCFERVDPDKPFRYGRGVDPASNYRDVLMLGDCDAKCEELAALMGVKLDPPQAPVKASPASKGKGKDGKEEEEEEDGGDGESDGSDGKSGKNNRPGCCML